MTAELPFRYLEQIGQGQAVYQEYSNRTLREYGFDVPILTPEEAGDILANIAKEHDFTLYEYFQSDLAGHTQTMDVAIPLLENLDRLIGQVLAATDLAETLVIISSDHGNIEDLSVNTHTTNPVPTFLIGCGKERIADKIKELADITPALLSLFTEGTVA
jgi:bisphosphoglycerate-independent phosphoglycerate mutase (AlkP superfamily)